MRKSIKKEGKTTFWSVWVAVEFIAHTTTFLYTILYIVYYVKKMNLREGHEDTSVFNLPCIKDGPNKNPYDNLLLILHIPLL